MIEEITKIVKSNYSPRYKEDKIKALLLNVKGVRKCDIVSSLTENNTYFAFIDNNEYKFTYINGEIESDELTKYEKEWIKRNLPLNA